MADLKVDIDADVSKFEAAVRDAQRALWGFDRQLEKTDKYASGFNKKVNQEAARRYERQAAAMERAGRGMAVFGAATVAGLGLAAKAAVDWESAWTGVLKTVDGSPQQLAALEKGLRNLATELPSSHREIAAVAEAAGQLGVKGPAIVGFTRTMIDLGETTNVSADQAATSIAQMANVMDPTLLQSADGVQRFGSTLVGLGNAGASTEADILAMATRMSGAGKLVGATSDEVLALASAMADMGITAELGGGVASRVLQDLYTTVKSGGDDLQGFADVAGMSASQFAKAFERDPIHALNSFAQGLNGVESSGGNVVQTLIDLGFKSSEEQRVLLQLKGAQDKLTDSLDLGAKAWRDNTALVDEAAKRYETTEAKIQIAKNGINEAAISLGETFLPILADGAKSVADFAQAFADLPGPVKRGVAVLGGLVGVTALAGGGFLMLAPKVLAAKTMLGDLTATSPRAAAAVGKAGTAARRAAPFVAGVGRAARGAAAGFVAAQIAAAAFGDSIDAGSPSEWTDELLKAKSAADLSKASLDGIAGETYNLESAWRRLKAPTGLESFDDWSGDVLGMASSADTLAAEFENMGRALETVYQSNPKQAAAEFDAILAQTGGTAKELLDAMPAYRDALLDADNAQKMGGDSAGALAGEQEALAGSTDTATTASEAHADALQKEIEAQTALADGLLAGRDAQRGFEAALDDARKSLKDNGATLDRATAKGRENEAQLDSIAAAGREVVANLRDRGESEQRIQKAMGRTRREYIDMATDMGMPIKKARELADELFKMPDAEVKVDADTVPARKKSEDAKDYIDRLKGVITADGDTAPAKKKSESMKEYIDRLKGIITADADSVPARRAGESARDYIKRLKGAIIKAGSDTAPARKEGESARDYIKRLRGAIIKVNANTSPATDDVDKFISKARKIVVEVAANFMPKWFGGGTGDGEGAGWPGSTPRGVSQMSAAVQSMDPSARITSGFRPGAVTATGYPSYHGMGRAIDIVSSNMGRTFDMLVKAFGPRAKELYYTPRGFIRNGQWTNNVAAVTRSTHRDHVHLALNKGGDVRGPGTGTSDDIPAWLSNGEHVLTAADVRKLGGQDAVYRLRGAIQAGKFKLDPEPTYADGGAVRLAEKALGAAERARSAQRRRVEAARAAERAARRTNRESDDRAAERRLAQAERELDRRTDAVRRQRERLSTLRGTRRGLGYDLRRGELMESATSSASGAYGVVDQMLELARSGDLSRGQSRSLANRAGKAEKAMRSLHRQAERLDNRLEKAKGRLEDIASIKAGVKSALAGEQKLSDGIQEGAFRDVVRTNSRGETWTEQMWDPGRADAKALTSAAASKASKLLAFAKKLKALRKAGMSAVILEEIAQEGSEKGTILADAYLADRGQIKGLNAAYKDIAHYSGRGGAQVAESFGMSAAQSLVKSLGRQDAKVEKAIRNWGVYMADGLALALSGKKTGLKKRAMGGPMAAGETYLTGELGPELIVPTRNSYALTADQTRRIATASQSITARPQTVHTGPLVNVTVEQMVTTDADAAVRRLTTKMTDAIHTHGLDRLAQGVR